jgi:hypothetical protein
MNGELAQVQSGCLDLKSAKPKKEDLDTLSELVKSVRSLIQIRIKKLGGSMSTRSR